MHLALIKWFTWICCCGFTRSRPEILLSDTLQVPSHGGALDKRAGSEPCPVQLREHDLVSTKAACSLHSVEEMAVGKFCVDREVFSTKKYLIHNAVEKMPPYLASCWNCVTTRSLPQGSDSVQQHR